MGCSAKDKEIKIYYKIGRDTKRQVSLFNICKENTKMEENTNTFSFFDYELNGRKLTINEMIDIHNKYEIACTAEYLFENYDLNTEQQAICLSEEVHRYMDKNDVTESDAINSVLKGDYKWR